MRLNFVAALGFSTLAIAPALLAAGCGSGDMNQSTTGTTSAGGGGSGGTSTSSSSSSQAGTGGQGGSTTSSTSSSSSGTGGAGGAMCVPSPEICDGLDNDCNGTIDDGDPGGGVACDTGQPGACAAGITSCTNGTLACNQSAQPSAEICNGVDDDCNGTIDDGNPGGGVACDTGEQGICAAGTTACAAGAITCVPNQQPAAETCDGTDEDCDGTVDNGNPGGGLPCNTGLFGACAMGVTQCQSGSVVCVQLMQPAPETCDGVDNDCNDAVDEDNPCTEPGQLCTAGACVADCAAPGAVPCGPGTVCNVSDSKPGACVPADGACVVTGPTVACGASQCGPGSSCNPVTQTCVPDLPCTQVTCNGPDCHGTACPCDRAAPACTVATLAQLNAAGFVGAAVDLDFDRQCNGWSVTFVSGTDFLRKITPAGVVTSTGGLSNLNMGEVAVPHGQGGLFGGNLFDASLAYNCCASCGCIGTPQGVGHLENSALPIIVPATITTGAGPFGVANFDTGPTGLTYGLAGLLYAGNVAQNGDYYAIDTTAKTKTLVATFPSRVHASAPYDGHRMLVALQSKEIVLLELSTGASVPFATASAYVTSIERDPFSGQVYVALNGGAIRRLSATGVDLGLFASGQKSGRIALAPDNQMYFLNAGTNGAASIQVFPLPTTY